MTKKIRLTKQRRMVLEKIQNTPLAWGWGEKGGREYFFTDGQHISPSVIEGMIAAGLLAYKQGALGGHSQEIGLGPYGHKEQAA